MVTFPNNSRVDAEWPEWNAALTWVQGHFNPFDVRQAPLTALAATEVMVGLHPATSKRYWVLFWTTQDRGPMVVWYKYDAFPHPTEAWCVQMQWSEAMWEDGPSLLDAEACVGRRGEILALLTDAYYVGGESTHHGPRATVRKLLDVRRCYRAREDWPVQVMWMPFAKYSQLEKLASDLYRAGGLLFMSNDRYGLRMLVKDRGDEDDAPAEKVVPPGARVIGFEAWEIPDVYPLSTEVDVHQELLYLPSKEDSRKMVAWTEAAHPAPAQVLCQRDHRKRWYPVELWESV